MSSSPYRNSGLLLNKHLESRRGLKAIAFHTQSKNGKQKATLEKATYATVCKTLQHLTIINEVLDANDKELRNAFGSIRDKGLLYVMIYELLFGKYKSIRGGGKVKRMIVKHESQLRRRADDYVSRQGGRVVDSAAGNRVHFPRYVRVNTLRANVAEIVEILREVSSKTDDTDTAHRNNETQREHSSAIFVDGHVPDLLVLPPTASSLLHRDHELVKSGRVVLQDKSSCFSALVLTQGLQGIAGERFDYIDACAAPGNKTSHLAALVHSSLNDNNQPKRNKKGKTNLPESTIFALDRDYSRFGILQERVKLLVPPLGVNVAVEPIHGDFLKADPSDPMFSNVRAIMLDPSCSGSGVVNSPDRWMDEGGRAKDKQRMNALSNFQVVALKHAMSFPNVDRIVYSTCSIRKEENEAVVSEALSAGKTSDNENKWELRAPICLEHWQRRGKEGDIGGLTKNQADCLVRCDGLDGDETNGFFVAFFVRKNIRPSGGPATSRVPIKYEGVPTYKGQFIEFSKIVDTNNLENSSDTEEMKEFESNHNQKPQARKLTEATDRSIKKREKKMAWKRKQALQKMARLENKISQKDDIKEFEKNQRSQVQKTKNDLSTKAIDKIVKKREKKLALKRKQALKKIARQKKKRASES